jgi:hypothetical protein
MNVQPCLLSRSERRRYAGVSAELLVVVGGSELCFGDFEYHAGHSTVVSAVERHIRMMRLAAGRHDVRVLDRDKRLRESNKFVRLPLQRSSERRELYGVLLERAL